MSISPGKVENLQLILAAMQEAEGRSVPDRFLAKVGEVDIRARGFHSCEVMVSGVLLGSGHAQQALVGHRGPSYTGNGGVGTLSATSLGLVQWQTDLVAKRLDPVSMGRLRRSGLGRSGVCGRTRKT